MVARRRDACGAGHYGEVVAGRCSVEAVGKERSDGKGNISTQGSELVAKLLQFPFCGDGFVV